MSSKDENIRSYGKHKKQATKIFGRTFGAVLASIIVISLIAGLSFATLQNNMSTHITGTSHTLLTTDTTSILTHSTSVSQSEGSSTSSAYTPSYFDVNFKAPQYASASQARIGLLGPGGVSCVQPATPTNMTLATSTVNMTKDVKGGYIGSHTIWSNSTIFFTTGGEMQITSLHTNNITLEFNKLKFVTPQGNGQLPNLNGILYTYSNSSSILWRADCSGTIPSTNIYMMVNIWAWIMYNQSAVGWTFWVNGTTYLTNDGNNGSWITVPILYSANSNTTIGGPLHGNYGFSVNDTAIYSYTGIQFDYNSVNATAYVPSIQTSPDLRFYVVVSGEI